MVWAIKNLQFENHKITVLRLYFRRRELYSLQKEPIFFQTNNAFKKMSNPYSVFVIHLYCQQIFKV